QAGKVLCDRCSFVEPSGGDVSVRFGRFVFDEGRRELRAGARPVPLSPKAVDLLALLVRERPRAISKAELHDRLWPATFVGETSLPRVVGEIRRALGDRPGEGRLVRTVQRFGYAFVADAVDEGARAGSGRGEVSRTGCALLWGDRLVPLAIGENVVGRDPEAALTIPSSLVSRRHACIVVAGERATLRDLGSKNGTLLRGRRVEGEVKLDDGDEVRIGPALLVFCAPEAGSTRSRR
ncbi:MAG TPA: FHA domain-containing protein, partial [Vicinamibacteria bacterium]|nr:FHA domain-containing protein [Vicinamibacteria bacterium]